MKILQIINSHALEDGGAQRLALELHRAYRARGHDAHLLSLMRSPTEEEGLDSLGFASPYRGAVWPRLLRFLRQPCWRDVEIIHVHLFPAQPYVALALAALGRRGALITTEHNTFNRRRASLVGRVLDRLTLRSFQKIISISDATRQALARWQPQTRDKLVTIQNGIDLTRFSESAPKIANQRPVILAVGRISEQKNYATALRAVALLKGQDFRFLIAGQDEMGGQMQALSRELGVEDRVEFLGYQSNIPALLSRADLFLLCSHWEGFGLAVAEAMAAGLPTVVPDVPGVREVVGAEVGAARDEPIGVLVDPHSPASVAAGLARLLEDGDLRREWGHRARFRAARFDIQATIEAHLKLYEQVRASSRAPRV